MLKNKFNCPTCDYTGSWMGLTQHYSKGHDGELDKSGYIIDELNRLSNELDRTPTRREFTELAFMTDKSCVNVFGTWNEALKAADLSVNRQASHTEEELISELNRLEQQLGRAPYYHEMRDISNFSVSPYIEVFGKWNNALKEANIDLNKHMGVVDDNHETQRKLHEWQKKVKERDSYECQDCGSKNHIHAHHIKKKSSYPEKMFDIDNGISLCVKCHAERHKGECCYDMLISKAKNLSTDSTYTNT